MATPLLRTKLYIPPVRPDVVSRPRLVARLNAGFYRELTLIAAPAGFGKTTLLSEWVADCGRPAAWLSLDEGDDDPALFLRYLIAALQQLDETIGQGAQSLLQSPQLPSGQGLATQLLNDVSTFPTPFLLVLDDYQAIRRSEIHEMLGFLIDNQPPQMHTVIATRRDPRLPLARWRARGEATDIRTPDLRFTVEEARDFYRRMGLDLAAELVEALEARTEGWITGLQLAAISLRGSHDPADFVRQFSGSDRYVIDYLVDEVVLSDAELATYKCYVLLWRGETEAAASYADAAEGSLHEEAPAATRGRFLTLRAHLCADKVVPFATQAIELMDESTPFFYGAALLLLAVGHKRRGNVPEMMESFRRLARLEQGRNPFMAAVAIAEMADALRLQGKRREALVLCQRAIEQYTDRRGQPLPSLIVVLLVAAMLAHEANELTLALRRAEQCATMAQQTGMSFIAAPMQSVSWSPRSCCKA